jgi:hypothetical protein
MDEDSTYPVSMYWRYAWRERVKAKLFSLWRAIPTVLLAIAQFVWKRNPQTPYRDLWILLAIIVAVYFGLFVIESVWKLVVMTPPQIYGEQVDAIGEALAKASYLERELRGPQISPQEQRRRELVAGKIKELGLTGRKILRCIEDHGELRDIALAAEFNFSDTSLNGFFGRAVPGGLILFNDHKIRLNPELKSAIQFVLNSEYKEELSA